MDGDRWGWMGDGWGMDGWLDGWMGMDGDGWDSWMGMDGIVGWDSWIVG
jgi:hypothetical protein